MSKIIEELWYGNISPNTDDRLTTEQARTLMKYIARHHDNLESTLNDEQKDILSRFDDCYAELTDINEREIFTYAFRLGARLAIDIMSLTIE